MGTYTGTNRGDGIWPGFISGGVLADPIGTTPGIGDDTLIGKGGIDWLDGGGDNDRLDGGDGRDTLIGGADSDLLVGGADDDNLQGNAPNERLIGGGAQGDSNDWLIGGEGNDRLDGDGGEDTMEGGAGDDIYYVRELGDVVIEYTAKAKGGTDTVVSMISYTLGFGLENLWVRGSEARDGKGNALDNTLMGGVASNVLKGVRGNDHLLGDKGADRLSGGRGDDELDGGKGKDQLRGGPGDDTFSFAEPEDGGDAIADFHNKAGNDDHILLRGDLFGFGRLVVRPLKPHEFQTSEGHDAQDAQVRFIFDTRNTTLWFDSNGSRDGGLTLLADLQAGAELQANDILLF